ncbi:unnamed protein product [Dicrocoelium dendriticum]|nr:unnamed protein product [Dicrocoelium dendriticum]
MSSQTEVQQVSTRRHSTEATKDADAVDTASVHSLHHSPQGSPVESEPTCPDTESTKSQCSQDTELRLLDPVYLPKGYKLLPECFDSIEFPQSYKENSAKETRLLEYCENFRRQYAILCPDRTRLLLNPVNECGVEKFVCTTLRPTQLAFPNLYTWDGAASFVADFLEFVPLVPSTELPKRLLSPSTTVSIQKGTCFEYSVLLCSMLLGVGYDAYVVSGYATRECCYMDETRLISRFRKPAPRSTQTEEETDSKKYMIRQPRDLTSQFEKALLAKELQAEAEKARKATEDAEMEDERMCEPPADPLRGLRVHAWVLVLAGKREVPEAFFIETLTGVAHPLDSPMYLGIESLWNATNYWVNMQDCSNGISQMQYNLEDNTQWEYLLPSGSLRSRHGGNFEAEFGRSQLTDISDWPHDGMFIQSTLNFELISHDSSQSSHIALAPTLTIPQTRGPNSTKLSGTSNLGDLPQPAVPVKPTASLEDKLLLMDLPPSWTSPISICQQRYEMRYPEGHKEILYRRCKVEWFAPYSEPDGIVFRLTNYEDLERTKPVEVTEKFAHRADRLMSRITIPSTNEVTEHFDHGRTTSHLCQHIFNRNQHGPQAARTMIFYHEARVDGLQRREQTPTTMKEYYVGREDRMCYREVLFGAKVKKFGPAQLAKETEGGPLVCVTTSSQLAIDKIIERFTRDPSKPADEDVAERIFYIAEDRIFITYHIGPDRIVPCTREFLKPPPSDDRRNTIQLHSDTHYSFQVSTAAL